MPPIRCLHIADLHFGMDNYGYNNPETGINTRLEDFSNSMSQVVDYAVKNDIDVVLFTGDAYKRNSPSPTEQRELVRHFCRLAEARIPVVMISGNHDIPVMHGRASSIDIFRNLRPDFFNVYVNRPTSTEDNPPPLIQTNNGPLAVCCLPYISPSFLRNNPAFKDLHGDALRDTYKQVFSNLIDAMSNMVDEDIPKVLMAHLTVQGCSLGAYRGIPLMSDEIQIQPSELANAGYDYVALGHIHQFQDLSPHKNCPVVYSGSIDRVDFGEKDEEKGFVVAEIEKGKTRYEFIPLNVRPFVDVYVEDMPGMELTDRILHEIAKDDIKNAVVRVRYVASDEEAQNLDSKQIHEALADAHYKLGFIRIPKDKSHSRRSTTLSQDVQLLDALTAYIAEYENLKDDKEALLEKAKEIDLAIKPESEKHIADSD